MATIRKLKSGSYEIRGQRNGVRLSLTVKFCPGKKEADRLLDQRYEETNHVDRGKDKTFAEAYQQYVKSRNHVLSPSTIAGYDLAYRRIPQDFVKRRISAIKQSDVQSLVNELSSRFAPKTVRNTHGLISAVMKDNIAGYSLKTRLPQKNPPEYYIPSSDDVKKLLDYVKGTKYEVAIHLAGMGLRRSEICALSAADLNGNELHIHRAMVPDENWDWVIKDYPKTEKGNRTIIVSDYIANIIREKRLVYGGTPSALTDYMAKTVKTLGLKRFSLHKLRHYFASEAHALGIPDKYIQTAGGWKSNYVMTQVYTHALEEESKKQMEVYKNFMEKLTDTSKKQGN